MWSPSNYLQKTTWKLTENGGELKCPGRVVVPAPLASLLFRSPSYIMIN